ncbi:MAG: phenylalanine--tRNA ligase subunit alpha, partial [Actinomycetota bacterium]|nr:phenylalanine--tRNA ligase subunit alpha [Actinomycetota bacterium]
MSTPDAGAIRHDALRTLEGAASRAELRIAVTAVLGKRSPLALAHRQLGSLDADARKEAGRVLAEVRAELEEVAERRGSELAAAE